MALKLFTLSDAEIETHRRRIEYEKEIDGFGTMSLGRMDQRMKLLEGGFSSLGERYTRQGIVYCTDPGCRDRAEFRRKTKGPRTMHEHADAQGGLLLEKVPQDQRPGQRHD